MTARQAERVKTRALVNGGPGWVPKVVDANLALARRPVRRRPTVVLTPGPCCLPFSWWQLRRRRPLC